jgi:hypothetical protein
VKKKDFLCSNECSGQGDPLAVPAVYMGVTGPIGGLAGGRETARGGNPIVVSPGYTCPAGRPGPTQ